MCYVNEWKTFSKIGTNVSGQTLSHYIRSSIKELADMMTSISVCVACNEVPYCEMNVTLIPFFLAANVVIEDMRDWKFGPECLYDVNISYNIKEEPFVIGYFNSTMKCRSKDSETLFCRLHDVATAAYLKDRDAEALKLGKPFLITFNEYGVQHLMIQSPFSVGIANIIRKIVNQLNINRSYIDQVISTGIRPMSYLMSRERTPMGVCLTTYVIKHKDVNSTQKKDTNFQFEVLLTPTAKPFTNLSVHKIRKRCTNPPQLDHIIDEGILEMGTFNSTISINDGFKTFTELNGYIKLRRSNKRFLFKEITELNLDSIKPAREKFPSTFHGENIDLNMNTDIPHNTN